MPANDYTCQKRQTGIYTAYSAPYHRNSLFIMTSLAKAAYGAKMRRQSAPPALPLSPPPSPPPAPAHRTGIKVHEIPPQLCHLTGDELATPFPPIALGGYIRYYRVHCGHPESFDVWEQGLAKFDLGVKSRTQDVKKRQRASASPRSSSSSTESIVSSTLPPPRRPILSIIHEDSRETMRSETNALPMAPYKARVAPHPSTSFTKSSSTPSTLTLSLAVSSSPRRSPSPNTPVKSTSPTQAALSTPLSPGRASLRRRKRRILRTPSVENDFARSAKELFGLKKDPGLISRANSTGSEMTEAEEDIISSTTASVNTALTSSVLDTQSISSATSVSSSTTFGNNNRLICGDHHHHHHHHHETTSIVPSRHSLKLDSNTKRAPLSSSDHHNSDSDGDGSSSSPTISTPSTSFTHKGLLAGAELRRFGLLDFDQDEAENEGGGNRESWASYVTAKSYLDSSLPIVLEAN